MTNAPKINATVTAITKAEREDLQRLVRQREKVLKSAAKLRSDELLADFENQMAAQYTFDDDAVWAEAARLAEVEVRKAQEKIAERCNQLGIPKQFAPGLDLKWRHRGYDNMLKSRREELRRVAKTQIAAMEQKAIVRIEQDSLEAQTQLAIAGLTSDAARAFIEKLPTVETLMPALSYQDMAGESDPPIVEQILTPGAYRLLTIAREQGTIPWDWLVDESRSLERRAQWNDPWEFSHVWQQYRRDRWNDQPHRVEVWSEKGTVRGVLAPVLNEYGVGFRVMHGFTSATVAHDVAEDNDGRPLIALYAGDWNPSGLCMSEVDLPARLERYEGEHIEFRRIALQSGDLEGLTSFPAADKTRDPRYRWSYPRRLAGGRRRLRRRLSARAIIGGRDQRGTLPPLLVCCRRLAGRRGGSCRLRCGDGAHGRELRQRQERQGHLPCSAGTRLLSSERSCKSAAGAHRRRQWPALHSRRDRRSLPARPRAREAGTHKRPLHMVAAER
jgi:hypothetical protein